MRINKYIVLLVIVLLSLNISCRKKNYKEHLSKILKSELGISLNKYNLIILIPGSGCGGCISKGEDFFMKNIQNKEIMFILTHNVSNKGLKLRFGSENIKADNVLVDKKNTFYLNNFEEKIYPMAIKINENTIEDIKTLDEYLN